MEVQKKNIENKPVACEDNCDINQLHVILTFVNIYIYNRIKIFKLNASGI